jgi:TolB-like protein
VLYFQNLTGDTADASLADGLTDAVIARLGQVPRITVKSRGVVARFRGRSGSDPAALARTLRVANLVTAGLRRSGRRLRITVELTRASTGVVLWSDQYTRADDDLLGIEEEISRAVAREVAGRLLPQERASLSTRLTRNGVAYNHFLRGNAYLAQRNPVSATGAISEFEAAAALDTTFSEALARVALVHEFFLDWGWGYRGLPPESLLARGFAAADRALALNPLSSDAWMARGLLLAKRSPRTYDGAVAALERAVALDPRNAEAQHQLGAIQWQLGHDTAAVRALLLALDIEPGRSISLFQLAITAYTMHRLDEARRWLDSTIASDPTFAYAYAFRSYARARESDLPGARDDADNALQLGGPNRLPGEAALAAVDALAGDTAAARRRAAPLARFFVDPARPTFREGLFAASAFVAAGDNGRALDVLESVQPRGAELWSGLRLPVFDALRSEPRLAKLIKESRPATGHGAIPAPPSGPGT